MKFKGCFKHYSIKNWCYRAVRCALISFGLATPAAAGYVSSISDEVFNDGTSPYWEVSVKCTKIGTPISMRKAAKNARWCTELLPDVCHNNKYTLSRKICSRNFKQKLQASRNSGPAPEPAVEQSAAQSTKDTSENNLREEELKIEEQRMLIRKRQIELEKRELELKNSNTGQNN